MNTFSIDSTNQLRFAQERRESQIQRSMLREYLASTRPQQTAAFRLRAVASNVLFALACTIKPTCVEGEADVPAIRLAS